MKKLLTSLCLSLALIGSILVVGCGDKKTIHVEQVTLDKDAITLTVGESDTLTATVLPEDATATVNWISTDATVVTVNGGEVTAVGVGNAAIMVYAETFYDTCFVTVNPVPAVTEIGESNWKNAFQKIEQDEKQTRMTLDVEYSENGEIKYKGKRIDSNTDLSEVAKGMTPETFFQMFHVSQNPQIIKKYSSTIKMDTAAGKLSVSKNDLWNGEEKCEYRVDGTNIKLYKSTKTDENSQENKWNEVYGPYPSNEVAKQALTALNGLNILDSDLILSDLTTVKVADAFSYFIPTDATTFYGSFKYASPEFEEPVDLQVTIKFDEDLNDTIASAEISLFEERKVTDMDNSIAPEYVEKFKDITAKHSYDYTYTIKDVGTTQFDDVTDGSYTENHYAISTPEQFASMFTWLNTENGLSFVIGEKEKVSIKQIDGQYHALYERRTEDGVKKIEAMKYYIVSEDEIAVFDGRITKQNNGDDAFESWSAAQSQPLTVEGDEFASLLAILPEKIGFYFDTYNTGKNLPELYSAFSFDPKYVGSDLTGIGAVLTSDTTGNEVEIVVNYTSNMSSTLDFNLNSFIVDNTKISVSPTTEFTRYNPYASVVYENAIKNAMNNSFVAERGIRDDNRPSVSGSLRVFLSYEEKLLYVYEGYYDDNTRTVYKVEGNDVVKTVQKYAQDDAIVGDKETTSTSYTSPEEAFAQIKETAAQIFEEREMVSMNLEEWSFKRNGTVKSLPSMYDWFNWNLVSETGMLFGSPIETAIIDAAGKVKSNFFDGKVELSTLQFKDNKLLYISIGMKPSSPTPSTFATALSISFYEDKISEQLQKANQVLNG